MHKIPAFLFCLLLGIPAFAQPKGYSPVKNTQAFQQELIQSNRTKQTISSDFTQTKNLSLLEDRIVAKVKFLFKKEDRVRIEYTSPYYYLLVMNGGQILVKDEQKTSRINTGNSKLMQSVNRVMIDCMQGSVFQNPDFTVTAYENNTGYLLQLVPATAAMKNMFRQIEVQLDRRSLDVSRLTMKEAGGDYTDMDFRNTKHNVALDETLFKVK